MWVGGLSQNMWIKSLSRERHGGWGFVSKTCGLSLCLVNIMWVGDLPHDRLVGSRLSLKNCGLEICFTSFPWVRDLFQKLSMGQAVLNAVHALTVGAVGLVRPDALLDFLRPEEIAGTLLHLSTQLTLSAQRAVDKQVAVARVVRVAGPSGCVTFLAQVCRTKNADCTTHTDVSHSSYSSVGQTTQTVQYTDVSHSSHSSVGQKTPQTLQYTGY